MRSLTPVGASMLLALVACLPSCQADRVPSSQSVAVEEQPIRQEDACYAALFRYQARTDRLDLLDVSSKGSLLLGEVLPVPPNGTFRNELRSTFLERSGLEVPLPLPETIQDARFSPDARALFVLDRDDELSMIALDTQEVTKIDSKVFPGFALSNDGRRIVYSKGEAPMLDAYVLDLGAGATRQLTSSQGPTWGFAFSPDDRTIAFVYSPLGFSSVYTIEADGGEPKALTNVGVTLADVRAGAELMPIPDGRKPPMWVNGVLVFENSEGVFGIGPDGSVAWERPGATRLFRGSGDVVHYHLGGAERAARMLVTP